MKKYAVGEYKQVGTPSNPDATFNKLYFKSDNNLYKLDNAGNEVEIGGGTSPTTMAGFNSACTDGDFAFLGEANIFTENQTLEKTGGANRLIVRNNGTTSADQAGLELEANGHSFVHYVSSDEDVYKIWGTTDSSVLYSLDSVGRAYYEGTLRIGTEPDNGNIFQLSGGSIISTMESTSAGGYAMNTYINDGGQEYRTGIGGSTVSLVNNKWFLYDRTNSRFNLVCDTNGLFGFNKTDPSYLIDGNVLDTGGIRINSTGRSNIILNTTSATSGQSAFVFQRNGANKWLILNDRGNDGDDDFSIYNGTASADSITITEDNKVGIGKTGATEALDVNGKIRLGNTSYEGLANKTVEFASTPTTSDDNTRGFVTNDKWIDTSDGDKIYILKDDTTGSAVWNESTDGILNLNGNISVNGRLNEIEETLIVKATSEDIEEGDICWVGNSGQNEILYLRYRDGNDSSNVGWIMDDTINLKGRKISGFTSGYSDIDTVSSSSGFFTDSGLGTRLANLTRTFIDGVWRIGVTRIVQDSSIPTGDFYINASGEGTTYNNNWYGPTWATTKWDNIVGIRVQNYETNATDIVKGLPFTSNSGYVVGTSIISGTSILGIPNIRIAQSNISSGNSGVFKYRHIQGGYTNLLTNIGPVGTYVYAGGPYGNKPTGLSNTSCTFPIGRVFSDTEIDYGSKGLASAQRDNSRPTGSTVNITSSYVSDKLGLYDNLRTLGGIVSKGGTNTDTFTNSVNEQLSTIAEGQVLFEETF